MAISPNDRQRVMRTSRVEEAPNPGPWPQATPVAEVSQPDGDNYTGYDDDGGGGGPGPAPTPALALSSNDWNPSGGPLPACSGQSSDPGNQCGAAAFSPQLSWTLTDDPGTITEWRLRVTDDDAGGYIHWSVDDIPFATTSIAQETDPFNNGWPAGATINATSGGGGAFANGFEGFAPPAGENHTYSFVVTGHAADGSTVVTSNNYQGTFLG